MSKEKFDPSKVFESGGVLYYDKSYIDRESGQRVKYSERLSARQAEKYYQWKDGGTITRKINRPQISQKYKDYFFKNTLTKNGNVKQWARPMALKGGKNSQHLFRRAEFKDFDGKIKHSNDWGANINKSSKSSTSTNVLKGFAAWSKHLLLSVHQAGIQAENFRIMATQRALKVFKTSFKVQAFYSKGGYEWEPLAENTLRKRARRVPKGKFNQILKEYGDLYDSIKYDNATNSIYTDIVPANAMHNKKHSICYAGYHNEGEGTYGRGFGGRPPKPYIERRFIGHSTYLDPFQDNFMSTMVKRYMFDSVFLVKKLK